MKENPETIDVPDLEAFARLVEQDKVGVYWLVRSEIGPEWIGSWRELNFFVDGIPVADNELTKRLADALIDGLAIPATSQDHVIRGEGELQLNGNSIEVVYDWSKAVPYDDPVETGEGVFTLVEELSG